MSHKLLGILATTSAAICLATQVAQAEDKWADTVSYSRTDGAQLSITEPDGYQISVKGGSVDKTDTAPTIIAVPNANAFYSVTFTAPNGASWTKKFEVKKYSSTDIKVRHSAGAAAQNDSKPSGAKHIGTIYNHTGNCTQKINIKLEFIGADNQVLASEVALGKYAQIELPAGSYSVRAYAWMNNAWTYHVTRSTNITADGWELSAKCTKTGFDIVK